MMSELLKYAFQTLVSSKWSHLAVICLVTVLCCRKKKKIREALEAKIIGEQKRREEGLEWAREQIKGLEEEEKTKIAKMNFKELREALQKGEVKADTVVRVYYSLALAVHEKTNCLTSIIKTAIDEARELDEKAKDPAYTKPGLFGMPLSVKEAVEVKGSHNTWGLAKLIDNIATKDSLQVLKLRMEGMVPFVTTNVPTTCLTYNCSNSVYGTTSNPHAADRTCGGSSGGEGALIGAHGSLVGIGSDIGGSIRVPAAYSGCCGFKPSADRCSMLIHEPVPLRPFAMPTEGPLAQDPHTIVEVMRCWWKDNFLATQDSMALPIDFREDLFKEGTKYRIGYYKTDGFIDPIPGVQRVIDEAVELLKSKGHELVPFSLDEILHETAIGLWTTAYADGGRNAAARLKDEPLSPLMAPIKGFIVMPLWKKKMIGRLMKFKGDMLTAEYFLYQTSKSKDVQTGIDAIYGCRKKLVQKMKDENIDIILCPPALSPAVPHAWPNQVPFTALMKTLFWNVMDFPAGVVTTSTYTEADEAAMASYDAKGLVEDKLRSDLKGSVGLPLSVQLVAPRFRDEMVLRAMCDLYDALKKE